jgi:hypothetical protein
VSVPVRGVVIGNGNDELGEPKKNEFPIQVGQEAIVFALEKSGFQKVKRSHPIIYSVFYNQNCNGGTKTVSKTSMKFERFTDDR